MRNVPRYGVKERKKNNRGLLHNGHSRVAPRFRGDDKLQKLLLCNKPNRGYRRLEMISREKAIKIKALAIDIGNSSTAFGLFEGERLKKRWICDTKKLKKADLKIFKDCKVVVSSVVPSVDKLIKKILSGARFIDPSKFDLLKIKIRNKKEIGADRVVNAYAAKKLYGYPVIVVDFGTATTFDVVSSKGEYIGGSIVSGIRMTCDALSEKTAKLPNITIKPPKKIIGGSTVEAMRSGILYGYVSLVEGMIARLQKEMGVKVKVVATGGYAKLIAQYAKGIDVVDMNLTLKGLSLV